MYDLSEIKPGCEFLYSRYSKKITLAKFGFLTYVVHLRDDKISVSKMGVRTLNSL